MTDQPAIRVLICDDHPIFREGLRLLLERSPLVQVVADVGSGPAGVRAAAELSPQVVVMDLQMPQGGGVDAIRQIVAARPETGVLVLTMYEDEPSIFAAMKAGARAYLLKAAEAEDVLRGIVAVSSGEAVFSPGIAGRVLALLSGQSASSALVSEAVAFPELTPREREVLELIAAGRNNAFIVRELFISANTVRNHISNIFAKLQVADRAEAIVRARQAGLGDQAGQ